MLKEFIPIFKSFFSFKWQLLSGIFLSFLTFIASISLLALSGWFLSASFLAGLVLISAKTFNFFTPGAAVRSFSIIRTVSRYFERIINHDLTFKMLAKLRVNFYAKIIPITPIDTKNYRSGDLLNRLVSDIDTLDHLYLRLLVPFFSAILCCLFIFTLFSFYSFQVALVMCSLLIVSIIFLPLVFYRLSFNVGWNTSDCTQKLRISILDYISKRMDLLIHGAEKIYKKEIVTQSINLYEQEVKMAHITGLSAAVVTLSVGLSIVVMIFLASTLVQAKHISPPIATMFILAVMATAEALIPLPVATQMLGKVKRSAMRINDIIDQKPHVTFPETSQATFKNIELHFDKIAYQYPNSFTPAFRNVNLMISANESVAITGHTGCGKSTLINLLARFDDPTAGNILINGRNLKTFNEACLRNMMSILQQDIHIFSARLRDNLLLAKPNATDKEIIEILRALDLIDGSSKSHHLTLDTWVGQGGRLLSGGEIQRIGIARILLQDKPLVVLDEPTENLDKDIEKRAADLISEHCKQRTLLVITHKLVMTQYVNRTITWNEVNQFEQKMFL